MVDGQPVPGQGYATYRLRVLIDSADRLLALRTGNVSTALNLYVNQQRVYQAGKVGRDKETSQPRYTNDYVLFRPTSDTLDITLQVANFHNREGGAWSSLTLGTERTIRQAWRNAITTDFFLIGSILIIALYHLILFFFRKKDRSPLYFGLFCWAMIVRIATVDNYGINFFLTINWSWVVRLEYLSFYLGIPLFASFFYHLFPSVVPVRFVRLLWVTTLAFLLIVLILPPYLFAYTIVPYQCVTAVAALYVLYLMIIANRQRQPGSLAFMLGFFVIFLAFANDALSANEVIRTPFVFSLGLFVFIFFQTFVLSKRFSLAFNAVEGMNQALSYKNEVINERNEALKQLNKELDVFVYRTSHDLRAPISSVMGLINIMKIEKEKYRLDEYLSLQEKSLLKLDGFIQDILNYSRNARLEISPTSVDFRQLLDEVFALHSHLPNFVRIERTIEVHQPELFMTDVDRLTIILNNLISNAIRYCNVHQDSSYVRVMVDANASFAQIAIADNGVGIAPEHIDQIFGMFYRANTEAKGSGLGLFIVEEMVQKLKGTIQVESQLHQGTTFKLTVPNLRTNA